MTSASDKAKGRVNQAFGKARQRVGKALGSDKMQVKGAAQEIKGKAQVGDRQRMRLIKALKP